MEKFFWKSESFFKVEITKKNIPSSSRCRHHPSFISQMAKKGKSSKQSTDVASSYVGPKQIGAFKTLKIGQHWCYMRAHAGGEDERTMFLVNLPIDTTEKHIRVLFAQAGQIESVRLWKGKGVELMEEEDEEDEEQSQQQRSGSKKNVVQQVPKVVPLPPLDPRDPNPFLPTSTSAHVTFLDESSLARALEMHSIKAWPDPFKDIEAAQQKLDEEEVDNSKTNKKRSNAVRTAEEAAAKSKANAPPVGLEYLLARHRAVRPALSLVKEHADSVMALFEYRLKNPKQKSKASTGGIEAVSVGPNGELLDADGFIIVQSTGKYGRTADAQGGSVRVARSRAQGERNRGADDEPAKKKKKLELDDFYRFQRREAKRQELADLRAKFQADQEKIKELKANRNFKPF